MYIEDKHYIDRYLSDKTFMTAKHMCSQSLLNYWLSNVLIMGVPDEGYCIKSEIYVCIRI
jgi:hypothetical protein